MLAQPRAILHHLRPLYRRPHHPLLLVRIVALSAFSICDHYRRVTQSLPHRYSRLRQVLLQQVLLHRPPLASQRPRSLSATVRRRVLSYVTSD